MPVLTASALRKQLAAGKLNPVYLLIGDDDREVADLVTEFTNLVDESFRAFNVERVHAGERPQDAEMAAVSSARILPMLSPVRIVFLLRADRLLKPTGRKAATDEEEAGDDRNQGKGASPLEDYLAAPEPMSTLVITASDANKTLRLVKALYKQATVVECWGLKTGRDARSQDLPAIARRAEAWVRQAVAAQGRRVDPEAARLLAERAGADMGRLRADLDRVSLYAEGRTLITRADVEAVIGGETSHDAWAVTSAIEQGNTGVALKQLALVLDEGAAPPMVLGQLAWLVRDRLIRAQPDRAATMLEAVMRADLDLKTSGGEPRVILERLVVELCGAGAPPRRPATRESASRRR